MPFAGELRYCRGPDCLLYPTRRALPSGNSSLRCRCRLLQPPCPVLLGSVCLDLSGVAPLVSQDPRWGWANPGPAEAACLLSQSAPGRWRGDWWTRRLDCRIFVRERGRSLLLQTEYRRGEAGQDSVERMEESKKKNVLYKKKYDSASFLTQNVIGLQIMHQLSFLILAKRTT